MSKMEISGRPGSKVTALVVTKLFVNIVKKCKRNMWTKLKKRKKNLILGKKMQLSTLATEMSFTPVKVLFR